MYTQILSKNELVINAEEEKGEEEGRKKKTKNEWTRKRRKKETKNRRYIDIELPTNTSALSEINENNRERKVNAERWTETRLTDCVLSPLTPWRMQD